MGNICPSTHSSSSAGNSVINHNDNTIYQSNQRLNGRSKDYVQPNYHYNSNNKSFKKNTQTCHPQALDKRLQIIKGSVYKNQPDYSINGEITNHNHLLNYTSSLQNLQHIAEREPDDIETDPTINPTRETLLMQRSCKDVEQSMKKRRSFYDKNFSRRFHNSYLVQRSSSTSTILIDDSTVTRPNPKSTVKALSQAVYLQIKNRDPRVDSSDSPEIFDERIHPIQNEPLPDDYAYRDPDQRIVHRFIRCLFQNAQLSPECAIVTMVYLERLLSSAELELTPCNWKRILLCAILLASKVWDDQAVWNVDFCQILRDLHVDDVNELERQFLEIIQFNINVPSSVYAKYYFDIRSLSDMNCQPLLLSLDRAYKLEAYSRVLDEPICELFQKSSNLRRHCSVDALMSPNRFRPAILS